MKGSRETRSSTTMHLQVAGLDVAELAGMEDRSAAAPDPEVGAVELERERNHVGLPVRAEGGYAGEWLGPEVGDLLLGERHLTLHTNAGRLDRRWIHGRNV